MSKYYAQEKRVFDINKVTVVGSPTITSDGVASGFSSGNYITAPSNFLSANSWKIIYPISTTQTNTAGILSILSIICMQIVFTPNSKQINYALSSNGSSWDIGTSSFQCSALDNTQDSIFVIEFTGTKYEMYFIQKGIKINGTTIVNSNKLYANSNRLVLGNNRSLSANINGSIDLTALEIYVDGELVYSPTKPTYFLERRKEGFDLSKFTVVGTPTITDDGVLDGSTTNSSNYLTIPYDITNAKSVRVEVGATSIVYDDGTSHAGALFGLSNLPFYAYVSNNGNRAGIDMWLANSSGSPLLRANYNLTPVGSKVKFVWELRDGIWTISFETSVGYTMSRSATVEEITDITTSGIISVARSSQWWLTNLPSISITVDGKEVFTGAKEKFYAMRGM